MPSFPLLDVAIGLCFVYLLLSLVCSSLNEGLESLLRNRANDLEAGIRMLLSDPNGHSWWRSFWPWTSSIKTGITREFYMHPLIRNLFRNENKLPNYIPARNFSLALMDLMFPDPAPGNATPGSQTPSAAFANLPEGLKRSVTLLMNAAQGDADQARANIEGWFNSTMDRVSGWYKHRTQYILFAIGLGVTIGVNADSIEILSTLAHSKALAAVVAAAGQATGQPLPQNVDVKTQVSNAMASLQSLDIGIGWQPDTKPAVQPERVLPRFFIQPSDCGTRNAACQEPVVWLGYLIGFHWLGWLITAAAIALGAPFWFDTLSRFMEVRSTVKPKEIPAAGDS